MHDDEVWARAIARRAALEDDASVSAPDPAEVGASAQPGDAEAPIATEPARPGRRRNAWVWVSVALAVVSAGLLIWGLSARSDADSTQAQLDSTQKELAATSQELDATKQNLDDTSQKLDSTQKELDSSTQDVENLQSSQQDQEKQAGRRTLLAGGAIATVKALYDDLSEQLGATQEDLATTQKDLDAASEQAAQAEKDAAAAKEQAAQAGDETDKAKAEAKQAQAEADATQSKAKVAKDCAKAYISALGTLFEGDSVRDQAPAVRDQFASITADCQTALAGT
jgi:hypothetical protein